MLTGRQRDYETGTMVANQPVSQEVSTTSAITSESINNANEKHAK
jgi:hypothetical protein